MFQIDRHARTDTCIEWITKQFFFAIVECECLRIFWFYYSRHIDFVLFDGISGLVGKVDFTVRHLPSATTNVPSTWDFSSGKPCIGGSGALAVSN